MRWPAKCFLHFLWDASRTSCRSLADGDLGKKGTNVFTVMDKWRMRVTRYSKRFSSAAYSQGFHDLSAGIILRSWSKRDHSPSSQDSEGWHVQQWEKCKHTECSPLQKSTYRCLLDTTVWVCLPPGISSKLHECRSRSCTCCFLTYSRMPRDIDSVGIQNNLSKHGSY